MSNSPLISILVPIYNVDQYLEQCLDSIISQTFGDLEIICIDDGSTDNSSAIVDKYAANDSRIKALHKPNSGYGDSMNRGLEQARGQYIGIVESDDWVEPNMFSQLYKLITDTGADFVKCNFWNYYGKSGRDIEVQNISECEACRQTFEPEFAQVKSFSKAPSIWAGLYNSSFLRNNEIKFQPTPGASYQDTGFVFKTLAMAQSIAYTNEFYLHYRNDNENSSIHSVEKLYHVVDEFNGIKDYLVKHKRWSKFAHTLTYRKYSTYLWNLYRIDANLIAEFQKHMQAELAVDLKAKLIDYSIWDKITAQDIKLSNSNTEQFVRELTARKRSLARRKQLRKVLNLARKVVG